MVMKYLDKLCKEKLSLPKQRLFLKDIIGIIALFEFNIIVHKTLFPCTYDRLYSCELGKFLVNVLKRIPLKYHEEFETIVQHML